MQKQTPRTPSRASKRPEQIAAIATRTAWQAGELVDSPVPDELSTHEEHAEYRRRRFGEGVTRLLSGEENEASRVCTRIMEVAHRIDEYLPQKQPNNEPKPDWVEFNNLVTGAIVEASGVRRPLTFPELEDSINATYALAHGIRHTMKITALHEALVGMRSELGFEDCLEVLAEKYPDTVTYRRAEPSEDRLGADFYVNEHPLDVKSDIRTYERAVEAAESRGRSTTRLIRNPVTLQDFGQQLRVPSRDVLEARADELYKELVLRDIVSR